VKHILKSDLSPKKIVTIIKEKSPLMLIIFFASVAVAITTVLYNELFVISSEIAKDRFVENPSIVFLVVPAFFLISAYLCRKYSPNSAGSGTYHVLAALKKLSTPETRHEGVAEYLSPQIMLITITSSLIAILGGGALGREGPIIQVAACIFVFIALKIKRFVPNFDLRSWITAGSAAGLAAAFNAPLAGIMFAIEEIPQFHFEEKFSRFKIKAFFAVIAAGAVAQYLTDSYVLFDFPLIHFLYNAKVCLVLLLVSAICGLAAWILKEAITATEKWRNSITGNSWYLIPITFGLLVALISVTLGKHTFGSGIFTIQESLQSTHSILTIQEAIGRFVNVIASTSAGCAGGLVLPAIAIGGEIGSVTSELLPMVDARMFIVTGMAACIGAMINAPLTAAVLLLEITNQTEFVLPLFLSALVASWVCKQCDNMFNLNS
jgi:H+/Cl- antiporter ClcA